ncbi:MAG TPA: response regulator transcription factor [Pyrinomonadaceae bacterium]|nr:response regulator transcription factor [Pyrinomonadaceae bacterium]
MNKLRILLADDHEMIREGLKLLVNRQTDMETIGEANNGRAAVALARELKPDVVVMDISMPEMNGLKATERLKTLCPEIKVLTLTRHADDAYIRQLLQAGASGYLLKKTASGELVRAIRIVATGGTYLDPAVTGQVISDALGRRAARNAPADKNLSGREEEVLRLTAWGYANKEIAARLDISVRTVEVYKTRAMEKMGMKNRIDIVRYALLQGWLQDN